MLAAAEVASGPPSSPLPVFHRDGLAVGLGERRPSHLRCRWWDLVAECRGAWGSSRQAVSDKRVPGLGQVPCVWLSNWNVTARHPALTLGGRECPRASAAAQWAGPWSPSWALVLPRDRETDFPVNHCILVCFRNLVSVPLLRVQCRDEPHLARPL